MTLAKLTEELIGQGLPRFRAKQIYEWLHVKLAEDFEEMSSLPKELRAGLSGQYDLKALKTVDVKISQIDGTRKYLFQLDDENIIESVLMKYKHGNSVCISSQVGCRMGCRFCASALGGLERNLTPSEMLDQIYRISRHTGERVSNVVVMGSGEPMDNYDNLVRFIRLLTDENGLNISQRNVTVSTCGIVPEMKRLADEKLQITLALSLHAPDDDVRSSLMPIAGKYPLREVMDACQYYFAKTGRRMTFEYSLVSGVNDNPAEARALATLIKEYCSPSRPPGGMCGHVNLIPVNPIKERDYVQSGARAITDFKNLLEKSGINVTIRREMGRDINGACGQLRKSYIEKKKEE